MWNFVLYSRAHYDLEKTMFEIFKCPYKYQIPQKEPKYLENF